MTSRLMTAAACFALTCAISTPASAVLDVSADPVAYWNQLLTMNITGNPVTTSRAYAMVEVAMFDAVNATTGNTLPSYTGVVPSNGDTRAAASTAARDVLLSLLPLNGSQARVDQRAAIEAQYQASISLVPLGQARSDGIATGASAAAGIIAARAADGSAAPLVPVYSPTNPPIDGRWQQTTPGAAGTAVFPWWGDVTTWNLASGSQFRPAPPPDIASPEFAGALAEVMLIGSATSPVRTGSQTASAQYWATAGAGLSPWINAALAATNGGALTTLQYAQMFALLATNAADATIGVFDAKYEYDYWRPVTAIHDADPTSTWTSLIAAPPHPSYVSGHSAFGGAASTSLMYFLGDADACFANYVCFDTFELAATDAANSRLWGGIHYSFDNQAGLTLGQEVAQYGIATSRFVNPVPEPASWMTMLLGFGIAGWAVRRRRSRRSADSLA